MNKMPIIGGIINKARRFIKLRNVLPGPADYSLYQPNRKSSLDFAKCTFGTCHRGIVEKECSLVPGPGAYVNELSLLSNDLKPSIPKVKIDVGKTNGK
jgi:hypothetical protein